MGTFIDRDPKKMMKFGGDVKSVLEDMSTIIRGVQGVLANSAKDLDDPSQKQIQALNECCADYFKHMKVYEDVADKVYKEGKRLLDIQNGG